VIQVLSITTNSNKIDKNRVVTFYASGGVEPYVFSLTSEDDYVNGSIDSVTGIYTAPNSYGDDKIIVTDANSDTAEIEVFIMNTYSLLIDIIRTEMELENDQVVLYNQKFNIPNDSRMYVSVAIVRDKIFSNKKTHKQIGAGYFQIQDLSHDATIMIDCYSRKEEPINRKDEILMALKSDYAQNQMNLNSFRAFELGSDFIDVSRVDGTAIPYRFQTSIKMQYITQKIKQVAYYDTFQEIEVKTN
jgi:hypothetical protein